MLCRGQRPRETVTRLPGWQWRHSSDRSVSQTERHMQGCQGLQLCTCSCAPVGPHLGTGAAAANRAVHAALLPWSSPHTGRSSWGAGFRALARQPGSCWTGLSTASLHAPIQVCVPGSFPRTVPCLRAGAKFIRGSQVPEHQLPKSARLREGRTYSQGQVFAFSEPNYSQGAAFVVRK